mgnify:CR=1 FL=1
MNQAAVNGFDVQDEGLVHAHIIPHSHCDPGWLDTFEGYYQDSVERILSAVTAMLQEDKSRRFVWSEISFFSKYAFSYCQFVRSSAQ